MIALLAHVLSFMLIFGFILLIADVIKDPWFDIFY